MIRIVFVIALNVLLQNVIYLLFTNCSLYFFIHINFIYINICFHHFYLWFIYFMCLMLNFFLFLLSKKIVSSTKFVLLTWMYIFITLSIVTLILTDDFIFFMILFESLFFPICFISLFFNFNNRFIFAIYYLVIFSSFSSILCIIICIIVIFHFNSLSLSSFIDNTYFDSLVLNIFIWTLLFLMFAIKYPIWPLHVWLPEVHVEVNTEMSALLASIVLKIGFFGVFKFIFLVFNNVSIWYLGFVDSIIIIGLSFLALSLLFLCDYKKIIANWSVIHTGVGLVLLWHNDLLFIGVLLFCNLGHIISSGFMFIVIGHMYDNYGLRIFLLLISFFGISIWSSIFIALLIFNIDFPFMLLFFIDIFVLYGLASLSLVYLLNFFIIVLTVFVSTMYIYLTLSFFSFVWLDKYLRLDICINDVYFFFLLSFMSLILFFLLYILF